MPSKKRRLHKPATCERCGRIYSSSSTCRSHERVCRLIPTPTKLAAEFLSDHTLSIEYLSTVHGVSREFIRSHLTMAGLADEVLLERWDDRRSVKRDALTCDECKIYVFAEEASLPRKWKWHVNGMVRVNGRNLCIACAKNE